MLSHLTCASLSEDRYGVVQRDIPRILEAFLSFLSAIEGYQVEIKSAHVPPSKEELAGLTGLELETKLRVGIEVAKAGEALGYVSDGAFLFSLDEAGSLLMGASCSTKRWRGDDCAHVRGQIVSL